MRKRFWNNKSDQVINGIVLIGYAVIITVFFYSLALGKNLMKWDIWQAEYPNQVMMTDAIKAGTLPLWNPLMNMGMPYYASIGTPVWYPITLIFAMIGYTPLSLSWEYLIHLIIAAYGMYFFVKGYLREAVSREKLDKDEYIVAYLSGVLYSCSGLFLSNAQHIMIIISAAWIPWVLYFAKKYLCNGSLKNAILAGGCAGLILLGGYPEVFYDLFIIMIPFFLLYNWNKNNGILKNMAIAAAKYIIICVLTVFAAAVTVISFLDIMPYMTRNAATIQQASTVPLGHLISLFLPKTAVILDDFEISMGNYYVGVITLLALVCTVKIKMKHKKIYGGLILFCFAMSLGYNTPLYGFFQKVLPMYATFRFPPVFRVFIALFLITYVTPGLKKIVQGKLKYSEFSILEMLIGFGLCGLWFYKCCFANDNSTKIEALKIASIVLFCVACGYLCIGILHWSKKMSDVLYRKMIVIAVLLEVFLFVNCEMSISITTYTSTDTLTDDMVKADVREEYSKCANREKSIDFSNSRRTNSGRFSEDPVFNKTLDDNGYLSVKLSATENYKQSYNHSITEANPVVFFTTKVISEKNMELDTFLQKPDISSNEIYVEGSTLTQIDDNDFTPNILEKIEIESDISKNSIDIKGDFYKKNESARVVKVYIKNNQKKCRANIKFTDVDRNESAYEADYTVEKDKDGVFVNIYFPNSDVDYKEIKIEFLQNTAVGCDGYYIERMRANSSQSIDLKRFSFNEIELISDNKNAGYVTIFQSYYPGWEAYVDGEKVDIDLVNGCFMGIFLEAGKHEIILKFVPKIFYIGAGISLGYWLIIGIILVKEIMKKMHPVYNMKRLKEDT